MSNILDIAMYDFENICRTCLSRDDLKHLYGKCFPTTCVVEMLMFCTGIKFTEDDGLPVNICTNCINEINQAFSFAKRCETTDTILRNCVKTFKIELANDPSQSLTVEPIIKVEEEMKIDIESEIVLPNMHRTVEEVFIDNENVIKQEETVKIEGEEVKQEEDVKIEDEEFVEVKKDEKLIIENESDDLAEESYEEDVDEDQDEKSNNPCYSRRFTNSQIEETSSEADTHLTKRLDSSPPAKRRKIFPKPSYYECTKCLEKFLDSEGLKKHREEVKQPPNAPISCPVCNKMIKCSMTLHMRTHTGEKPYSCEICGANFPQASNLSQHKRVRHSEPSDRMYQCQTCEKSYTKLDLLEVHQKIHTGQKNFACHVCKKSFSKLGYLTKHKLIHTGKQPFVCTVCGKGFIESHPLKNHMRIHTGEKPYVCSVCSVAFTQRTHLKIHMKIHTGERPYSCEVCSKTFSRTDLRRIHMRIHTGEKPYTCNVCSKTFTQHSTLKVHMRIHTGDKPYLCGVCSKAFKGSSARTNHMRIHTGEKPYSCEVCSKRFTERNGLKLHIRTHTCEAVQ